MSRLSGRSRGSAWITTASLALFSIAGLLAISSARASQASASANALIAAGRTISGTVMSAAGTPAANETVKLMKKKPPRSGPSQRPPGTDSTGQGIVGTPDAEKLQRDGLGGEQTIKSIKSDSNGKFSFPDVQPGKYMVQAGLGKTIVKSEEFEVKADADPAPLNLKLNAK